MLKTGETENEISGTSDNENSEIKRNWSNPHVYLKGYKAQVDRISRFCPLKYSLSKHNFIYAYNK